MPSLHEIRRALARHDPAQIRVAEPNQAAVAMILRGAANAPEVLFIERASRQGDPWSGHMAFPGGRVEACDEQPRRAAEREALEEVGIQLEGGEILGRLDDLQGHHASGHPRLVISAFVYHVADPPPLKPNHEVQQAFWFPLGQLHDPGRHVDHLGRQVSDARYPGILVGVPERHVVWGLTYRFLERFFEVVGSPLPSRRRR
jgi:8-oxo-dGTP pyrophosphatase MutT (NUDIX family)